MNNRGYPGTSPNRPSPNISPGRNGPLDAAIRETLRGGRLLDDSLRETNERPLRRRSFSFPKIPYRGPPVPFRFHPAWRLVNVGYDILTHRPRRPPSFLPEGLPADWISCFNPTMPWDGPAGTGWSSWYFCPGGDCEPGYIHVPSNSTGAFPEKDDISRPVDAGDNNCGGGRLRNMSMLIGPQNDFSSGGPPVLRFAAKLKICPPVSCLSPDDTPDIRWVPNWRWLPLEPPIVVPPVRIQRRRKDDPHRETGPRPDPRPKPAPWEPRRVRRPSRFKYGKEKKTRSIWVKGLFALWSAATEVPDWVEGFWEAMPGWWRRKMQHEATRPLSIDEKALLIIENIELINPVVAIQNVLYNLAEDAIAGRIIRALDKVGIGVGFNGIPFLKNSRTGMWG